VAKAVLRAGDAPNPDVVGFIPRYVDTASTLFGDLARQTEMVSFGLDLSLSPAQALGQDFGRGLIYALLVVVLGGVYFYQQRMVAARASISPSMSASQQKLMQYLPVFFAVFQIFFLLGLVFYYIVQALLRIMQQGYITQRFYRGEDSLGRQAQRAGEKAREIATADGGNSGGLFGMARKDLSGAKDKAGANDKPSSKDKGTPKAADLPSGSSKDAGKRAGDSRRTTSPKNRPTPTNRTPPGRPGGRPGGPSGRPKKR
jgi:YidC/Oxa1 family membrane protein insertase